MKGVKGFQKGHPTYSEKGRFKKGFIPWNKGKSGYNLSDKHKINISIAQKRIGNKPPTMIGDKNHKWKGDKVGYRGLHDWVNDELGKAIKCEYCGKEGTGRQIGWANKDHSYKRNLFDWISLCASCHRIYDIQNNNYQKNGVR